MYLFVGATRCLPALPALPACPPSAPTFTLPLPLPQSHLECRLWNDVFVESQRLLGIPNGGWVRCGIPFAAVACPTAALLSCLLQTVKPLPGASISSDN
jgi:hypothetical protein